MASAASTRQEAIHEAEHDVPLEWGVGDVILDTYEVKAELGRGGFGTVQKVHHKGWNVDMAVKSALGHVSQEDVVREAEVWMELGLHPNIVSCYFVRRLGGIPRIFVEYVEGGTLDEWLYGVRRVDQAGKQVVAQEPRGLTRAQRVGIAIEICRGMHHAHTFEWTNRSGQRQIGLIHRDLKPSNILMSDDGAPRVTDFGLVRFWKASATSQTIEGTPTIDDAPLAKSIRCEDGIALTPAYAAPEQWRGHEAITQAADIYAFGVILYELFCGRRPFELPEELRHALNPLKISEYERMHCGIMPVDPAALVQDIDHELSALILQCIEKNPRDRVANFAAASTQLKAIYHRLEGDSYSDLRPEPTAVELLAGSLNNRALSYLEIGQPDRAATLWGESLKVDPHHLYATYNQLLFHWRTGRITDQAIVAKLTSAAETNKRALPLLALIHVERGDREGASSACGSAPETEILTQVARAAFAQAGESNLGWHECVATLTGHEAKVSVVAITADGRLAVSGDDDYKVHVWDLERQRQSHACAGHHAPITALAITRDGRCFASGSKDGDLRIWDMQQARCRGALSDAKAEPYDVECLQFLNGDQEVIAACSDGHLRLWTIRDGRLVHRFDRHPGRCNCVAVSPDGRLVACGGTDLIIRIWDVKTASLVSELPGHATYINGLTFVAGSDRLASASGTIKKHDTDIRLWDVRRASQIGTLSGHSGGLNRVVCSDDGQVLLSSSGWGLIMNEESCIRMWQLRRRRCLRTFPGHGGATRGLALTPDGRKAISAGEDKTVRLWKLARPRFEAPFAISQPVDTLDASARERDVRRQLSLAARGKSLLTAVV